MKAITLWQPWASLIAGGVKTIETRSWPAPADLVGERIAIHAAARLTREQRSIAYSDPIGGALNEAGIFLGSDCAALPLGAVVATARFAACVPMVDLGDWFEGPCLWIWEGSGSHPTTLAYDRHGWKASDSIDVSDQLPYGDFAPGRWAWLLEDVQRLDEPVPAKGRQRLWEWTP